jgi:hypothetical protein
MVKKGGIKSSQSASKKQTSSKENINKVLVENLVSLQKVLTNLSLKFDSLTKRLDNMIDLFEESAKTVVKSEINAMEDSNHTKRVLGKMDKLFEQNKLIARGLTLLNESTPGNLGQGEEEEDDSVEEGFDASPSAQGSPYAMPYSNASSTSSNSRGTSQPNFSRQGSSNTLRNQNPERSSFQGSSSFKAPKPNKLVREEDSSGNSKRRVPDSPPFRNF